MYNETFADRNLAAGRCKKLASSTSAISGSNQDRTAKVRAAIEYLHMCFLSESQSYNSVRLAKASELAMTNLELPSKTLSDRQLRARSRFILAAIASLHEEPEVCRTNIAYAAVEDPRWFRVEFEKIFQISIRPLCIESLRYKSDLQAKALQRSYLSRLIARRALAIIIVVSVGLVAFVALILIGQKGTNPGARIVALGAARPIWNGATRANQQVVFANRINELFEKRLDSEISQTCTLFI